MYKAMLRKEFKLLLASYKQPFVINFLLYGVFLWIFLMPIMGKVLIPLPKGLDPFILFCIFSIGMSAMLLSMTAPTTLAEKSLGIIDNMLAYTGSTRRVFVSKAAFLWAVAYMDFLFWSAVGLVFNCFTSRTFVDSNLLARDATLSLLLYPMLLFLVALVQVIFIYILPHLAKLVDLFLFGLMFFIFFYLALIVGKVMATNVSMIVITFLILSGLIILIVYLIGKFPSEVVVKFR